VLSKNDVSHYLTFIQDLRKNEVGKKLYLTAAASLFPWAGPSGDPLEDVSGFAKVLDHIAIMKSVDSSPQPGEEVR
jgi:chitinase